MSEFPSDPSRAVTNIVVASPRSSIAPSEDLRSVVSDQELPIILAGRLEDELAQELSVGGFGEDGPGRELKAMGKKARSTPYDPTAVQVAHKDKGEWIWPDWRGMY
jgi:hypothetical protein